MTDPEDDWTPKPATFAITDTQTGETRTYEGYFTHEFMWSEGNFACDCNRGNFFAGAGGDDDSDCPCGGERYTVRITAPDGSVFYEDAPGVVR